MIPLIRSLTAPLLSLVLLILASGLFNTFVSIRLEMEGYDPEIIGIVTAASYVGILVGSFKIDRCIGKIGHIRSFILFALTMSGLVLCQALWMNPWYWCVCRFFGGICMAGIFIVIESWLLMQSGSRYRGAILSIYLAVFYGALSLGQLLINLSDAMGPFPFFITAFLSAVSIAPIALSKTDGPKLEKSVPISLLQFFRLSPLGFMGGIVSGMVLAVTYGLLPVYAKEVGMSISEIGNFMAILIFGGLSLQWPLGYFADRGDRRRILNIASFLTAIISIGIGLFDHVSSLLLLVLAWLFGGFSFTLYPLSMAYTCEKVKDEQIVAVTGGFVLSYGIGAIAGPLIAPIAMDIFGSVGLFYFLAAIALLLGCAGLVRRSEASEVE